MADTRSPSEREADDLLRLAEQIRLSQAPVLRPEDVSDRDVFQWALELVASIPNTRWYLASMARELLGVPYDMDRDADLTTWLSGLRLEHRTQVVDLWRSLLLELRADAIKAGTVGRKGV